LTATARSVAPNTTQVAIDKATSLQNPPQYMLVEIKLSKVPKFDKTMYPLMLTPRPQEPGCHTDMETWELQGTEHAKEFFKQYSGTKSVTFALSEKYFTARCSFALLKSLLKKVKKNNASAEKESCEYVAFIDMTQLLVELVEHLKAAHVVLVQFQEDKSTKHLAALWIHLKPIEQALWRHKLRLSDDVAAAKVRIKS
jgi:hypothetical protein